MNKNQSFCFRKDVLSKVDLILITGFYPVLGRHGRTVALKLLPPDAAQDDKAKMRLLQEARAASALNHPNIVTIYSIEEAEGSEQPFE